MKNTRGAVRLIVNAYFLTTMIGVYAQVKTRNISYSKPEASITRNPVKLAKYLTRGDTSQTQMAYHLYHWVTNNIAYDVRAYRKKKPKFYTVKQTLRRKKGVCYQYSELFETLCRNAGISAHNILGYSKGASYFDGDIFYEADHSWNGVKLDSSWYLVDATWGAGTLVPKRRRVKQLLNKWFGVVYINDRYKFLQQPHDRYFMADPKMLIEDHLPLDSSWQLIDYMMPLKAFQTSKGNASEIVKEKEKVKIAPLKYEQWLGDYEFLSKLQYEERMAKATFEFNRRNTGQLGFSTYNRSTSHLLRYRDNQDEKELEQAKVLLKESVNHFNRQKKQVTAACRKMRTQAKSSVRQALETPNSIRQKRVNGLSKKAGKALDARSFKRRMESMTRTLLELDERIKNTGPKTIEPSVPSRVKKPALVEKNLEKLKLYAGRLRDDPDSLNQLYMSIDSIGKLRTQLLSVLIIAYEKLQPLTLQVSLQIQNNASFYEISDAMQLVQDHGAIIGSVKRSFDAQIKFYRELSTLARQTETSMRVAYQQVLKLVAENSQFSEDGFFDRILYRKYARATRDLILFRRRVINHFNELSNREFVLYTELAGTLKPNQEALYKNKAYIDLYEKKWVASINGKQQSSEYQYDRMLGLARNRLIKLP